MAKTAREMADSLIEIYSSLKKRYYCSKEDFKKIAGKEVLKEAFLWEVDSNLREDGYLLIDIRKEKEVVAVIKMKTIMKWQELSQDIIEDYEFDDWEEED